MLLGHKCEQKSYESPIIKIVGVVALLALALLVVDDMVWMDLKRHEFLFSDNFEQIAIFFLNLFDV